MSLIAHFPLQENSGGTAYDVRNGNDGSVNGATQGVSGILGNTAYSFNGTDDVVDITYSLPQSSFSVFCWINNDSGSNRNYISGFSNDSNGDVWWIATDENGEFYYRDFYDAGGGVGGSILNSSTTNVRDGLWHFVGVVVDYNDGEVRTYIDGQLDYTETSLSATPQWGSGVGEIGNRYDSNSGSFFDGKVCDVRFYSHALTNSEIQYLYDVATAESSLTTQWKQG